MGADGNTPRFPPRLRLVKAHPMSPCPYPFPGVEAVEPDPVFHVDDRAGCVVWEATGLRLVTHEDFRALEGLFVRNARRKHYLALGDAELALSEVTSSDVVRSMLAASVAELGDGPEAA